MTQTARGLCTHTRRRAASCLPDALLICLPGRPRRQRVALVGTLAEAGADGLDGAPSTQNPGRRAWCCCESLARRCHRSPSPSLRAQCAASTWRSRDARHKARTRRRGRTRRHLRARLRTLRAKVTFRSPHKQVRPIAACTAFTSPHRHRQQSCSSSTHTSLSLCAHSLLFTLPLLVLLAI